jgi:nicotinate dehydrogenase subunit B
LRSSPTRNGTRCAPRRDSQPNFPGHDNLHQHIRKAPVVKRHIQVQNGDFDTGIAQAVRTIEGEYEFPTQSHSSTGPACAVADVRDGGCTLYTSTQKPHYAAQGVAELLGLRWRRTRRCRWRPAPGPSAISAAPDGASSGRLTSTMSICGSWKSACGTG